MWLKHKRMILIVCAAVFLAGLFMWKNGLLFNKNSADTASDAGLTYTTDQIGDLVTKDTDGDGIPDWEEKLWGTDPTKKETTPGIPDSEAIAKLQAAQEASNAASGTLNNAPLTKTDQFSEQLFSTIAAATQDGQPLDPDTVNNISDSLIQNIQSAPQRKTYAVADIKTTSSSSTKTVQTYNDALNAIYKKYPIDGNIVEILQEFAPDPNSTVVNPDALLKLTPIIGQTNARLNALAQMTVPVYFAPLHASLLNAGEKLVENLSDIQQYNTDVIVSLGAATEFGQDSNALGAAVTALTNAIKQKLNN